MDKSSLPEHMIIDIENKLYTYINPPSLPKKPTHNYSYYQEYDVEAQKDNKEQRTILYIIYNSAIEAFCKNK